MTTRITGRPVIAINPAPVRPGVSAADKKAATGLKANIKEVLMRVRFGQPLAAKDAPRRDAAGRWVAPNGNKLIRVQLSEKPPAGSADMQSHFALVDPKTNNFYSMTAGGISGRTFAHGPVALSAPKFTGKSYSWADIKTLADIANKPAVKIPTAKQMANAMGAYEFHKLLKWSIKAPPESQILKRVVIRDDSPFDGHKFTGLVLKSDPNKFIIERTGGGRAGGVPTYSQPIDVTRIPK